MESLLVCLEQNAPLEDIASALSALKALDPPPTITRDEAFALWRAADAGENCVSHEHVAVREFALDFLHVLGGNDTSLLHAKFLMDAHLSLAAAKQGNEVHAQSHLNQALIQLESLCSILGEGERPARRQAELQLQYQLACAHVLFDTLEKDAEAFQSAQEARALLSRVPEQSGELGIFCYNCGVKSHAKKHLDAAVKWIELSVASFDRAKHGANLTRSLRLLCATHMDRLDLEQAKKACNLALEMDPANSASLTMLCRVHLLEEDSAALEASLARLLQMGSLTLQMGVDLCRDIRRQGGAATTLAQWALRSLAERFANDATLGLVRLEQLQAALDGGGGADVLEAIVSEHLSGQVRLSQPVCAEVARLAFEKGVKLRHETRTHDSPSNPPSYWIRCAIALAESAGMDAAARSQLFRLLSSLLLEESATAAAALQAAQTAIELCRDSAAGYYLLVRCHMAAADEAAALAALQQLAQCRDYAPAMMHNLAALAQTLGCSDIMVHALERFIVTLDDIGDTQRHLFTASARALVRALSASNFATVSRVMQIIQTRVQDAGGWLVVYPDDQLEGQYLAIATYNAAGAALAAKQLAEASTLFDLAATACGFQSATQELVIPSRKAAVSCFLNVCSDPSAAQLERLQAHLQALRVSGLVAADEMLLLEYRAALLQPSTSSSDAVVFMTRASSQSTSPILFERMAHATLQCRRAGMAEAAARALALSFQAHLNSRHNLNVERAAAVVRNLVHLLGLASDETSDAEILQFKQVMNLVKTEPSWPIEEKRWLAISIWNRGAKEWRANHKESSERWCGMAISLIKLCGPNFAGAELMKASYQQMLATLSSG